MKTVIIIVVVLAVIALAVAAYLMSKRRTEQRRQHAGELREKAISKTDDLDRERRRAAEAEARAEVARAEAERAEQRAMEARRGVQIEEAQQEDVLRRADALDPDVDHRAPDYRPGQADASADRPAGETHLGEPHHIGSPEGGAHRAGGSRPPESAG